MKQNRQTAATFARATCIAVALAAAFAVFINSGSGGRNLSMALADREQQGLSHDHVEGLPGAFALGEGYWKFPGMPWSISQTERRTGQTELQPNPSAAVEPGPPVELDQHLLGMIRSMMVVVETTGNTTKYSLETAERRGSAITVLDDGTEIPIAFRLSWPGVGDGWTELTARREAMSVDSVRLLSLPESVRILATRVSSEGLPQCHLLSSEHSTVQLRTAFEAEGWKITLPPADAGLDELFWISNATGKYEISVRSAAGASLTTAFVQEI